MAFKFCKYAEEIVMTNGKHKCRCKRDGHIVNNCNEKCPHLKLTFRARLKVWRYRRKQANRKYIKDMEART